MSLFQFLIDLKHDQYERAARMMQKLESHVIYHRIVARIQEERPDIFLSTIHDSVVTTPDHADYVLGVMEAEFAKIGLEPTIRLK